jgi:ubiquinone/menaquinone biosynthesis C-methylase UbiE
VTVRDAKKTHYIIRGGVEGRERLRILARVMQPATLSLLHRAGIRPGMACLDIGCGGGDVSFDLARLVGPTGTVVGIDIDEVKIEIARSEAAAQEIRNIEFRLANIGESEPEAEFGFAHARFLLSHLPNPVEALAKIRRALRPGGILVVADTDFRGYFCDPDCPALWRYVELYTQTVRRRGGDANIGPRLPRLLAENGFENVQISVAQSAGTEGEVKLVNALTMENITDAVLAEGLASRVEIDQIVAELYEFARAPGAVGSGPRVVEAWGYRAQA